MQLVFITGMFRSGTSLLARCVDGHPRVTIAPDAYLDVFKLLRNKIYSRHGVEWERDAPLPDNFFNPHEEAQAAVQASAMDVEVSAEDLAHLTTRVATRCALFSPAVIPHLAEVRPGLLRDVFWQLLEIVRIAYGGPDTLYVGTKDAWCEEFIRPLVNAFPDAKVLHIVRDPRATIASKKARGSGMYPILFLIRHWRKTYAYHLLNRHLTDNYMMLRYEDIIASPEREMRRVSEALGVAYTPSMVDPSHFSDGKGGRWTQNSSYGTSTEITGRFADRWKTVLTPTELRFIEELCEFEMERLGYARLTEPDFPATIAAPPEYPRAELAEWTLRYFDPKPSGADMLQEAVRRCVLQDALLQADRALVRRAFITGEFFVSSGEAHAPVR
ncbi:MAG: sulfotransferase [Candidatus Rokubacteria bacterium]|nr:sulfotransferase [Candidatus Rokubacteria bacterium]